MDDSNVMVLFPLLHTKFVGVAPPVKEVAFSAELLFISVENVTEIDGVTDTFSTAFEGTVLSIIGALMLTGLTRG